MVSDIPIRWTDPTTWPWMFYVWLTLALAGLAKPAWSWFRRRRAAGWSVAERRIESVEVTKLSFSFTTKRGYHVAELGYSYSVAGTQLRALPSTKLRSSFVTFKTRPWESPTNAPIFKPSSTG